MAYSATGLGTQERSVTHQLPGSPHPPNGEWAGPSLEQALEGSSTRLLQARSARKPRTVVSRLLCAASSAHPWAHGSWSQDQEERLSSNAGFTCAHQMVFYLVMPGKLVPFSEAILAAAPTRLPPNAPSHPFHSLPRGEGAEAGPGGGPGPRLAAPRRGWWALLAGGRRWVAGGSGGSGGDVGAAPPSTPPKLPRPLVQLLIKSGRAWV